MHIGEAGIEEPMWVFMGFMQRTVREGWFTEHPVGIRKITRIILTTPVPLRSAPSRSVVENGILSTRDGTKSILEIEFDHH